MNHLQDIYQQKITFKKIRLIRLDLPQLSPFVSGIGIRKSREAMIVEWEDQNGVKGYGECSCRPDPYYSDEFLDGAIRLVQQFIVPFLQEEQTLGELLTLLGKIRGWNFTKAAVEMAALQVIEKNTGTSPFDTIRIPQIEEVPIGISLGLYTDLDQMTKVVEDALKTGYKRLKFKISPNVNVAFFEAINPLLLDANVHVSFDANGSFTEDDFDTLAYFVDTYQPMIEQPFAPDRIDVLLKAKERFPKLWVCFDEELKSLGDVIKLHRLGLLDEVNLKVGRVAGVIKSIAILEYCATHQIPCWIGGMFETGIGRILNLRMAAYLPQAKAHDLSPSDRYFVEDVIAPAVKMNNGKVSINSLAECVIQPHLLQKYTINEYICALNE